MGAGSPFGASAIWPRNDMRDRPRGSQALPVTGDAAWEATWKSQ
jgi:hypothetical protein